MTQSPPFQSAVGLSLLILVLLLSAFGCKSSEIPAGATNRESGGFTESYVGPVAGVVATQGDSQVVLTWKPVTGRTITYTVLRSLVSGGNYSEIASGLTTTTYTDTGLTNGTFYYYLIKAVNVRNVTTVSSEMKVAPFPTISPRPRPAQRPTA